jgi:hypothetical protein
MVTEHKTKENDALVMIHARNAFYRQKYHVALGIFFLGVVVIAVLIGMLVYVIKHPPQPLYFATDDAGRFVMDVTLQQPNMSTGDVASWVVDAVQAAYSYDFLNYHTQLQGAQKYFTDYGWREYMKGLQASNNLLALTNRKQVVTARVIGAPQLIIEGGLGKEQIYAWKFQLRLLVTYLVPPNYDEKNRFQNSLIVTAIVERQSILSSYKGLGIVQMIAQFAQAAPNQVLSATPT